MSACTVAVFTPTAAVQAVAVTTLAVASAEVTSVGAVAEMEVVEASNALRLPGSERRTYAVVQCRRTKSTVGGSTRS